MWTVQKYLYIISLYTYSCISFAGGPLVIEGSTGNTPISYQNPNITLHPESGSLGALTNNEADTLMQEASALWNNVGTATINMVLDDSQITSDINASNFANFLPNVSGSELNANDGLNPIAYDNNGEIIDAFFGVNASLDTIGFAASIFSLGGDFFIEGYAVINGRDLGLTSTEFKLLIAHEIGHFIGLDHSQVNIDNQESIFGATVICTTTTQNNYPVMYPFVCRNEDSLHADDVSSLAALYPKPGISDSLSIIQGQFLDESGEAILGANIWVENNTTGEVVSITSDYLKQNNGFYKLYITPGDYILHANSINTLFNGGSSIGPYSLSLSDQSFIAPHPIAAVTYQGATVGADAVISVANNTTININFTTTGTDFIPAPEPEPEPEPELSNTTTINVASSDNSSGGTSSIYFLFILIIVFTTRQSKTQPKVINTTRI